MSMVKKYLRHLIAQAIEEVELVKITEADWHDIRKEMPNQDGYYLVSMRCKFHDQYEYIVATTHYSTKDHKFMINHNEITAWMELPTPYYRMEDRY